MLQIRQSGMGIEVTLDYLTDLGNVKTLTATVDRDNDTINYPSTSSLNKAGRQAYKAVMAQAELILEFGIDLPQLTKSGKK